MRTDSPRAAKCLIVQLVPALLQNVAQSVIALFSPCIHREIFVALPARSEVLFFSLKIVVLLESEERHKDETAVRVKSARPA